MPRETVHVIAKYTCEGCGLSEQKTERTFHHEGWRVHCFPAPPILARNGRLMVDETLCPKCSKHIIAARDALPITLAAAHTTEYDNEPSFHFYTDAEN